MEYSMTVPAGGVSATSVYQYSLEARFEIQRYSVSTPTADLMVTSVVGKLIDNAFRFPIRDDNGVWRALSRDRAAVTGPAARTARVLDARSVINDRLSTLYAKPAQQGSGAAYEARVLRGVWATAPYLHNGSVPNLWQLLTPPALRKTGFTVGGRLYDPVNVGFVTDQPPPKNGQFNTQAPGNGAGGHDFGTTLNDDDRWAIIEYMKTL